MLELRDAFADGADPALKVLRDERVRGEILWVDLEGEAAERAAVLGIGDEDALAVAGENREDALDGVVCLRVGGIDDHGAEGEEVALEHLAEERLLTLEEVVEAPRVHLGV